jgi:hypothetical protein
MRFQRLGMSMKRREFIAVLGGAAHGRSQHTRSKNLQA